MEQMEARLACLAPGPPIIVVVVDAEAEFDWSGPLSRDLKSVKNIRRLMPMQSLFSRYAIRPAYMIDYPVSSQAEAFLPLRELLAHGSCEIGVHLQPWQAPPFEEPLNDRNSFLCNLPRHQQWSKLASSTAKVEENFGSRPVAFKAGRYGFGPVTAGLLAEFGYQLDLSVLPGTDLRPRQGPDFSACPSRPYWLCGGAGLLEIPMTVGFAGLLGARGRAVHAAASRARLKHLRLPGVLARLRVAERMTLTPEGATLSDLKRLTRALLAQDQRSFTFSFHSPSLLPGSTPYVRDEAELRNFLARIEGYLDFFLGELGGCAMTPTELRSAVLSATASLTGT